MGETRRVNRLADATSPYLLQHADNPVDWWEWGPDAFAEARRRNLPVLLGSRNHQPVLGFLRARSPNRSRASRTSVACQTTFLFCPSPWTVFGLEGPGLLELAQRVVGRWLGDLHGLLDQLGGHRWLTEQERQDPPGDRVLAGTEIVRPAVMQPLQVGGELLPVANSGECSPAELLDDRVWITVAIGGQRVVVGVSICKQPCGHGNCSAGSSTD